MRGEFGASSSGKSETQKLQQKLEGIAGRKVEFMPVGHEIVSYLYQQRWDDDKNVTRVESAEQVGPYVLNQYEAQLAAVEAVVRNEVCRVLVGGKVGPQFVYPFSARDSLIMPEAFQFIDDPMQNRSAVPRQALGRDIKAMLIKKDIPAVVQIGAEHVPAKISVGATIGPGDSDFFAAKRLQKQIDSFNSFDYGDKTPATRFAELQEEVKRVAESLNVGIVLRNPATGRFDVRRALANIQPSFHETENVQDVSHPAHIFAEYAEKLGLQFHPPVEEYRQVLLTQLQRHEQEMLEIFNLLQLVPGTYEL